MVASLFVMNDEAFFVPSPFLLHHGSAAFAVQRCRACFLNSLLLAGNSIAFGVQ